MPARNDVEHTDERIAECIAHQQELLDAAEYRSDAREAEYRRGRIRALQEIGKPRTGPRSNTRPVTGVRSDDNVPAPPTAETTGLAARGALSRDRRTAGAVPSEDDATAKPYVSTDNGG